MAHITQIKKRALLAAAAAAKLCTTSFQSTAGIIYNDIADVAITNSLLQIDVDGGGNDLQFTHSMNPQASHFDPSLFFLSGDARVNSIGGTLDLANIGDLFNGGPYSFIKFASAAKTTAPSQYTDGPFSGGGSGYLGFTLGSGNNGWLAFSVAPFVTDDLSSNTITLHDYAYEDTGSAIEVGATASVTSVPEPASWVLFAMGAYFVSRRKVKAA